MGGYYTGNGEIISYHMKYILFAMDFQFSLCDISQLFLLYSCSLYPSYCAENGCFQECSVRRPMHTGSKSLEKVTVFFLYVVLYLSVEMHIYTFPVIP